ncbi:MAG TPA: glycerophosphodiester phosphodiesterase family protein [Rhodocyclaceae bacterium]|nr:glycerophosphodiester phosphodiesterase family protein [Rhodocyclaceae bacterium]
MPENTLAGFRLAARLGFKAVEFDVMLTADGVPILIHDETLRRTTGGHGRVADLEWAAISRLDAGARFHPAWAGEPVPRLADALTQCAALGLAVNVEIKPAAGHAAETGSVVARVVQGAWPAGLPLLFSSFSEKALAAAAEVAGPWPRALLVKAIPGDWHARLAALGCTALHARAADLSAQRMDELRAAGVPVAAYTVNSSPEAERCFALGATALFTDRLDRFGPA